MNGKLKIQEIANQTGLSISTVSRVLAGKGNTSAKAKQQVMAYAKSQGILQNLSSGRLMLNNIMVFAPIALLMYEQIFFTTKSYRGSLRRLANMK